jgi:mycothiol synthase
MTSDARTAHPYIESKFADQLELVRRSRAGVAPLPLPDGFRMRNYEPGDEREYRDLFRLAWPDENMLPHTLAHALPGGFLVVEEVSTKRLVGSCVAFAPETPSHGENGSLGWLVVDPAHGGRGIGAVLAATVTNRLLDEQYDLPWLQTEDDRLTAIRIYLGLGWEPHLYAEGMEARWRDIYDRLGMEGRPLGAS